MLTSFFNSVQSGMKKETYFDMCRELGTEPIEEEIPVEMDDFPLEVQEAINVYYKLKDEWDTMNGNYMGKSYQGLKDILDILEVDPIARRDILDWILIMDRARSKIISDIQKQRDALKRKD
jgi:hypothetical protein